MSNKNFRRDRSHKGFNDSDDAFYPPPFLRAPSDRQYDSRPSYDDRPSGRGFGGDAGGTETEATVKWFNATKGFGFVELAGGAGDAFLHVRQVEAAGFAAVEPGTPLKVKVGPGQKGQQVLSILEVGEAPAPTHSAPRARFEPRQDRSARGPAEQRSGSVKWFNPDKGFGFIEVDGGGRDVFVHASCLRRCGIETLLDGQRVDIDVVQGQKGLEASRVALI